MVFCWYSSNATSSGQRDLALAWRATNSGTFTVLVSSAYLGYSGSYTLDVFEAPGAFVVPAGDEGGALTNGGNYNGTMTLGDLDPWTFTASAGDNITLWIGTTNFYASLNLYGPDGALVTWAGDSAQTHNLSLTYQTTNSGTFTVLVSSWDHGGAGEGHAERLGWSVTSNR